MQMGGVREEVGLVSLLSGPIFQENDCVVVSTGACRGIIVALSEKPAM